MSLPVQPLIQFVMPRKKHTYTMICKNCSFSFQTTANRAVMCSLKCKQDYVLANIRCDKHGELKQGQYKIIHMSTSPHLSCYLCHAERYRTPEKKKISNKKKILSRKNATDSDKERRITINRKRSKEGRENLSDSYVAQQVRNKDKIPIYLISKDILEIKRLELTLKRLIEEKAGRNWRSVK